jgi:hypothetical protein
MAFEFRTAVNRRYQVFCRESLTEGNWMVLPEYEEVIGDGNLLLIEDAAGVPSRFYRVQVQETALP